MFSLTCYRNAYFPQLPFRLIARVSQQLKKNHRILTIPKEVQISLFLYIIAHALSVCLPKSISKVRLYGQLYTINQTLLEKINNLYNLDAIDREVVSPSMHCFLKIIGRVHYVYLHLICVSYLYTLPIHHYWYIASSLS